MAPRVLVVDDRLPMPEHDSASLRMVRLLGLLIELGWSPSFGAYGMPHVGGWDVRLREQGVHVIAAEEKVPDHIRREGRTYDAVVLSRPDVAAGLLRPVRRDAPGALVIYDTLDLHFVREFRLARHYGNRPVLISALKRKRQELGLVAAADRTLVVSEAERAVLEKELPDASVHVVSTIHEPAGSSSPFERRSGVLFVANFGHTPNPDAARHLVEDIWPRVRAEAPEMSLHIAGANTPDWLREYDTRDGIRVHGHVADLGPLHDRCRASVAPLRFGAGVKGKVLESLGRGLPVVGSPLAFEGIPVVQGQDAIVADNPGETAAALVRLHREPALWRRLSEAGTRVVADGFSADAARRGLVGALGSIDDRRLVGTHV